MQNCNEYCFRQQNRPFGRAICAVSDGKTTCFASHFCRKNAVFGHFQPNITAQTIAHRHPHHSYGAILLPVTIAHPFWRYLAPGGQHSAKTRIWKGFPGRHLTLFAIINTPSQAPKPFQCLPLHLIAIQRLYHFTSPPSYLPNAYLSIQALKAGAFSRLTTTLSSGHPTRCSTSFELK